MGERRYSVDPQGDVTLVLRTDPQKDFAVWDENDIPSAISVPGNNAFSPPPGESLQQVGSQQTPRDKSTSVSEPQMVETHYRVSSRHLILASEYFKRTLGPEWKEGATLKSDGHVTVHAEGWDGEAFLILLNIIHGHTRKVPKSIDLDMLAKIALLVDYYQCLEVSELFANIWFEKLIEGVPSTYTRDLILWLFVSWVFRQSELFTRTTKICSTQSRGPIQTLALPIPENFVGKIELQRQEAVGRIFSGLHRCRADLLAEPPQCSFECSSMLLGALDRQVHAINPQFFFLPPDSRGFSFKETYAAVNWMRSPHWYSGKGVYGAHWCSLKALTGSFMDGLPEELSGLTLDNGGR